MNYLIKAAVSAAALLVATQAQAANYVIDYSGTPANPGPGNPASPFYVKISEPTYIEAVINGIRPTTVVGSNLSFTDTFTFFLPFTGFGSGAVISTNFNNLDLTSAFLDIYNAAGTAVEYQLFGNRTTSGISVSLDANGGIPANRQVVLTVNGVANGGTYSGNLSAVATPAVPEPATWAMLLAGFGAVGFAMRRRRATQAVQVSFG